MADFTCFTLVFKGDPREFPNPFDTDTPYGRPYGVALGDALEELDELREKAWKYDQLCK